MSGLKKILTLALSISIFLSLATGKVFANETLSLPIEKTVKIQEILVGEVTEKREVNIKTFLTSEYRYQAYIYPNAVHYQINGKYEI